MLGQVYPDLASASSWRPSNSPVGTIRGPRRPTSSRSWRPSNSPVGTIAAIARRNAARSWRPSNSPVGTIKTRTYVYSDQVLAPFQLPSWYNRRDGERGRMGVLAPFQLPSWYNQVEVRQPGHGVLAPFQLPSWYNFATRLSMYRRSLGAWRPSNSPVGTIPNPRKPLLPGAFLGLSMKKRATKSFSEHSVLRFLKKGRL